MSAPHPELLRSLGRLVRGLSSLFWGVPVALIVCVGTAGAGWFSTYGMAPLLVSTGLLLYALQLLGAFQPQERPWQRTLDRAKLVALINLGLSPFLYWWHRVPDSLFFGTMTSFLVITGLLFLILLNRVLLRLAAMLPDEALRHEMRNYTALNRNLLIAVLTIVATYVFLTRFLFRWFPQIPHLPPDVDLLSLQIVIPGLGVEIAGAWLILAMVCLLILLPLAMTMALIWKTKEVILDSVFGGGTA